MGLDMYFYKRKKNETSWDNTEEVGYFRKANAIHNWLVENIQGGNDDCGAYPFPVEKIKELRDLCEVVINNTELVKGTVNNGWSYTKKDGVRAITKEGYTVSDYSVAEELLPTSSGFFFGSTDYDMYYIDDLKNMIEFADNWLSNVDFNVYDVIYSASW